MTKSVLYALSFSSSTFLFLQCIAVGMAMAATSMMRMTAPAPPTAIFTMMLTENFTPTPVSVVEVKDCSVVMGNIEVRGSALVERMLVCSVVVGSSLDALLVVCDPAVVEGCMLVMVVGD